MAKLSLKHIYKVYPNGAKAVSDFNMEIEDKEFIVFVGPSGCGKSTTLRMIAGLEDITAGELYIGDDLVNDMEPKDRDIAMVFQNYALYPHMTVYDNMAFGLKLRHVPKEEIHKKVLWAAEVLKLTEYLDRKPRAMSGGQRQRVALGRAILRNPKVFLLDEPLSNLDAKLRTEMRAEIAKLHNELQTTFIYVTHDQVEAMTLGTRVVVMKLGRVQQIDSPQNLYEYPDNKFVAGFIGTPQMNFFEGTLRRNKDTVNLKFDYCDNELEIPFNDLLKVKPEYFNGKKKVWVGLRCENISLDPEIVANSKNIMKVKVSHFEELGNETLVYGDLNMNGDGFLESSTRVIVKSYHGALNLKQGDVVEAAFDMKKVHFFDRETEETIIPRIPKVNVFDCDVKDNKMTFLGNEIILPKAMETNDFINGKLLVPTNAINFVDDGIEATVVDKEEVNKTKFVYLKIKERIFFAITDKEFEIGSKVHIAFENKALTILNDKDEKVVTPLVEKDKLYGMFTNFTNDKKATDTLLKLYNDNEKEIIKNINKERGLELGEIGLNDTLLKATKESYLEEVSDLKSERTYKISTTELGKEGKAKINSEYKEKLNEAKQNYEAKVKEIKLKSKDPTPETIKKAEEINKKYDELIAKHENEYKSVINDIKLGEKKFSEISKKEANALNNEYKAKVTELKSKFKEERAALDDKFKNLSDPKDKKEYDDELNRLYFKLDKNIEEVGYITKPLYININGFYLKSKTEIDKRVVQALGISVFKTNYRFELNHYDYEINGENGIPFEVKDIIDYGYEKFIKCESHGNIIYVKVDKEYNVNDKVNVSFKLDNINIYEQKFDIRLY